MMQHKYRTLQFRKKMLYITDDVNWLQSSEDFLCRQILFLGPKAISGSGYTPG